MHSKLEEDALIKKESIPKSRVDELRIDLNSGQHGHIGWSTCSQEIEGEAAGERRERRKVTR